jgi:hypothetical protein
MFDIFSSETTLESDGDTAFLGSEASTFNAQTQFEGE